MATSYSVTQARREGGIRRG